MDINLNKAHCIIEKTNFTHTVVTNICSGAVVEVPHGTVDYLGGLLIFLLVVCMAALVGFAIRMFMND